MVVGFGEVVGADGFECGLGDVFGAVTDGGDGCLADEAGEGSDATGGALVEVGGMGRDGAGFGPLQVEVVFDVGDDVAERLACAVAGGEGPQSTSVARPASWAPLAPAKRGVAVTLMPA
ncbi:hypothetical protein [Streptomyces wedmorensis]